MCEIYDLYDRYNLNKQTFVVLEFATVESLSVHGKGSIRLQRDAIIEIAAVKIEKGEIKEHFSSFVAIDGYDAHDYELSTDNFNRHGLSSAHLIGAKPLKELVERLHDFIGKSTIVLTERYGFGQDPFEIFKETAAACGYAFNNSVIFAYRIMQAARLQEAFEESDVTFENASTLQIAEMMNYNKQNWREIFFDCDVFFDPEATDYMRDRDDPLSWALAFAQAFINIVKSTDYTEYLDNDCPF